MPSPTQVGFWPVGCARPSSSLGLLLVLILAAPVAVAAQSAARESRVRELKELSIEELMELEVTSVSKTAEKLSEAPSAIQVVTSEDIRRSGATNLPEALRLAGNLQVAQKGSHAWGISARGFNTELANKLLVLVDGRAVYTPLYSGVFWDRQDYLLDDIDRIEVISGPGGTLWGANAVNGVINVISKTAKETQGGHFEAGGGTELRSYAALRQGGAISPNLHYRIYGKYSDRDGADFENGHEAPDDWHMAQGGFRIDAEASAENTFTLQGDIYRNKAQLVSGGTATTNGGNLLGRWSRVFSEDSDLQLQLYYDRTHLSNWAQALTVGSTVLAPGGVFEDTLDTYDLEFQHRFLAGTRHRIVWGFSYRFTHDEVGIAPALGFFPSILDQHLFSAFVQDEIRLNPTLALTLGTKLEHNDYTQYETEPNVRLQWTPVPGQMVWSAISRAVRTPSRIDRDVSLGTPPHFVLLAGGADFESETVTVYELGHRAQVGSSLITAVSLFYDEYDRVRSTALHPTTIFPLFFKNDLQGETYGAELSADYQATERWRLHLRYNLLKQRLRVRPGGTDFNNALNETADPAHQFSLRTSLDLPGGLELDGTMRWVDKLPSNDAGSVVWLPAYTELDLRLGWRSPSGVEIAITGQNLLQPRHREYRVSNAPQLAIERSVHGKVVWRF
jgi:iron complex outermembrane receptor protein